MNGLIDQMIAAQDAHLLECLLLFVIPFLHEDVAIFTGAMLVVEYGLPVWLALGAIFLGMIVSDFWLYSVGNLASRNVRLRRMIGGQRIERLRIWVESNAGPLIVIARALPGLMFPVYIACGMFRVPLRRFGLLTVLTALLYLPVVFYLVRTFGGAVLSWLGTWSWIAALAAFAVFALASSARPNWERAIRFARAGSQAIRKAAKPARPAGATHSGMPSLARLRHTISFAEKMPTTIFYIPLAAQWVWLGLRNRSQSLPTLANPKIEMGGLWGESKSAYLDMVAPEQRGWLAEYTTLTRAQGHGDPADDLRAAEAAMAAAGLTFPVVVKPDVGWRGYGVQLLPDSAALARYLAAFPAGRRYLLQRPLLMDGEAGVLYVRLPGEESGRILSLTFRYFPYVVGDGVSTLRNLVLGSERTAWKAGAHLGLDAMHQGASAEALGRVPAAGEVVRLSFIGSNRVGGLYRDAHAEITPALERRFDEISKALPEFYYARYDIRFASVERLREGEEFGIIEINGAGGESIHVWDPETPLREVYRDLFEQQRLLFEIGARNRARGYRPKGLAPMLIAAWRQHRMITGYPPSS
ncbi:VTT domain-containing protein [Actibacterium sp. D379-3]